ncbi:MAG: DHHA1 domain-containing protein [archaeon]
MLTEKQVEEIKEHLERAQNPVFFFDNDQDGLCSFLLLQRFIGRGKGVAIKSFPGLDGSYFKRAMELGADYIFILDKHAVEEEFFKEIEQVNIPVVWIDHHAVAWIDNRELLQEIPEFVFYYNPLLNEKESSEPVSALCYQVTKKKEDLWLAVVGCISDKFVPDFYHEFRKDYPDLSVDYEGDLNVYSDGAFDIYYKSQIGKITMMMGFGLKDSVTNVVSMLKFLMKAKSPYEVLEERKGNQTIHRRFEEINEKFERLIKKATEVGRDCGEILFFNYGGDMGMSTDLSNRIKYLFPEKVVVLGRVSGTNMTISVRGKSVREKVLKVIECFENATGGGHEDAVGVKIKKEEWEEFKNKLTKLVGSKK